MTMTDRSVRAGDIFIVDLDPIRGSEQSGRRPVLVISVDEMNMRSRRMIVCPITSNTMAWTTKVPLPEGATTRGMVLTDQVRSIDKNARILRHVETVSHDFVLDVRAYVGRLLGLEPASG
jgi:mRNA interferase MazF